MINIDDVKNTIQEFAYKYNFVQQIDIENIENSISFNKKDYFNIDHKNFVSLYINKYTNDEVIQFGKIEIVIDSIDEEEFFSIEKNDYFLINIPDFSTIHELTEEIIKQCKKYQLI